MKIFSAGNQTSANITGLNEETVYYHRVRTEYGSLLSENSGSQTVTTGISSIGKINDPFQLLQTKGSIILQSNRVQNKTVFLYDVNGKLLNSKNFSESCEFNNLQPGFYILKIEDTLQTYSKKVIVY